MGFIKKAAVASAMATAVVAMVGQGGAFAASAGGAVGVGTITPGLQTDGSCVNQTSVTFNSAVLVYASTNGPTVSATSNTSFAGASDGCETLNKGQGHGNLSGGLAGTVSYNRNANLVTLTGTINSENVLAGACIFLPTAVNPVTAYALVCVAATT